ncbi:hypothetical protein GCM10028807_30820 [Spirosoma daeguense]
MGWLIANIFFQSCGLLGWYLNRKQLPARLSYIALMIVATLLIETIAYLLLRQSRNNLFLFHFLAPIQYALLVFPYSQIMRERVIRNGILVSIGAVFVVAIIFALTVQPITVYNTYTQLLAYILLTIWASLYLWQLLTDDVLILVEREPLFWISIAIIFYAVTNFVIMGTINYLIANNIYWARILYNITTVVAFIMYGLFAFSFFSYRIFKINGENLYLK